MTSVNLTSLMLEQTYINTLLNKKVDYCLSVHGLGFIEFIIMHKLHGSSSGTLSRINLADSIGLTGSGVTRLLSPMIKNNIILKIVNSKNARQSLVSLTSTGKELYKDALNSFEDSCNSIYSSLEESEVEQLLSLLNKIKC